MGKRLVCVCDCRDYSLHHHGDFHREARQEKGYRGYFFTGFFFNFIGLIYVVGLPLSKDRAD